MPPDRINDRTLFDAVIIGGGVVGCAIARRLTLDGWRIILLEKAHDILDGASKGNSAILHTGFDAPPGSLEARCMAAGYAEYLEIHRKLGLPLIRSGALVLAWSDEEEARLPALMDQARENAVDNVSLLSAAETRKLEPGLSSAIKASFQVPGEYLIDPWSAPHAYLLQAIANQAALLRDCEVTGGHFDNGQWRLDTSQGIVRGKIVINAAGLYADIVDDRLLGKHDFTIHPRKGQFIVCRTAFGNLLVGPTAEEQDDRQNAGLVPETLAALRQRGEEILPGLAHEDVTAIYAGLRPASEFKDYQIHARAGQNYVTVGGIRSTGLSSALGVARHVQALCEGFDQDRNPLADPIWPQVGNLVDDRDDKRSRDWQCPGNDGIVCHCELVTRREIETVLSDPLAPQSLAGLKRRTRVTMGRCQGFYCSAALAKLTHGRLKHPMVEGDSADRVGADKVGND